MFNFEVCAYLIKIKKGMNFSKLYNLRDVQLAYAGVDCSISGYLSKNLLDSSEMR